MPVPGELLLPSRWSVTAADRQLFRRLLRSFVPPGAFDAHAHLYSLPATGYALRRVGGDEAEADVGRTAYRRAMRAWMGDRCPADGLFFPSPTSAKVDALVGNRFVTDEVRRRPRSRALLLARPGDDPADIERELVRTGAAGLKVYYVFVDRPDPANANLEQYVRPWMWELAGRRGLVLMIHLVKSRALADPSNQSALRRNLRKWPGAKVILAHAARGFCGRHTIDGVAALAGLDNVYFDTSAVCESDPLLAILRQFGPDRLLFGSDFPVCMLRGRAVSVGDGFGWFTPHNAQWDLVGQDGPTLVGIESLLALQRAVRLGGYGDTAVETIFGGAARGLLATF